MNAKSLHAQLRAHIRKNARVTDFNVAHYVGTSHAMYNLPTPLLHSLAKQFRIEHGGISTEICINLVNLLFHAPSYEEKVLASMILGEFPDVLASLSTAYIDTWMGLLTGWAEVDTTCDEIDMWLRHEPQRGIPLLTKWNTNPILEKRRASLVVLCNSVRHDPNPRWKNLGLQFIDTLTHEKHVMITKAISWLLRAMIKFHKTDVVSYLNEHKDTLPNIAVREATKKLLTGRKN